jgi:ABC-type Na+ efflux pump permease subunit
MRILNAMKKELLEVVHDRTMLLVLIAFPVFVMLFMGSSFESVGMQGLPVGVVGPTNTTFASVLFAGLNQSGAFNLQGYGSEGGAMEDFRNGQLRAIIIVPEDFEDALRRGGGAEVRIVVDNSDISLQEAILAAMSSVVQASSTNITRSYVLDAWDDLYELNSSASSLAEDIEKSKSAMEATRKDLVGIRENMSQIDVGKLEASLDSASLEIARLQVLVAEQNRSGFFNDTHVFLYNASAALNESIDTVEDTHAKLVVQTDKLNDTITALNASIAALEAAENSTTDNATAAALRINILALSSMRDSTQRQMVDAQDQIRQLEQLNTTLQAFRITLEDYEVQLSEAEQNQSVVLGNALVSLSSMNASFGDAKQDIGGLKGLLAGIDATTAQAEQTLEQVLGQTDAVDRLILSLQDTVETQTGKDPETIAAPLTVKIEDQYIRASFVDFVIPRVISISLLFSCFLFASISLVREKTSKTIVRLLMMPGVLANVVIAKIATITLVSLVQVAIILAVGTIAFSVALPIDMGMLIAGTVISGLVLSSIGILIGLYARSESGAVQTSLLIAIPMLFLGNIIFSSDLLPTYTQVLQQLLPLAHITNIFKIVLITYGNPTADIAALLSYFVLLAAVIGFIVLKRRDITHYV